MKFHKCTVCGKQFKAKKNGKPSFWVLRHFTIDKKHYDAMFPPGLVFESREDMRSWAEIRLHHPGAV
jgi:hypothetical protein